MYTLLGPQGSHYWGEAIARFGIGYHDIRWMYVVHVQSCGYICKPCPMYVYIDVDFGLVYVILMMYTDVWCQIHSISTSCPRARSSVLAHRSGKKRSHQAEAQRWGAEELTSYCYGCPHLSIPVISVYHSDCQTLRTIIYQYQATRIHEYQTLSLTTNQPSINHH